MESIDLSECDIKHPKTKQGDSLKRVMGVSIHFLHSDILKAIGISNVVDVIRNNTMIIYRNLFKANTPTRDLESTLIAYFILKGSTIKGTLLERIVGAGVDSVDLITGK